MNNKLLFSLFFLTSTLFTTFAEEKINHTPRNSVICWDLRDVLLTRNRKPIPSISWDIFSNADNKWELIKLVVNYSFWKESTELVDRPDFVMDEIVQKLAVKYPALAPHMQEIMELITNHSEVDKVVAILEEVKEAGYQNYIASNIGQESYERMTQILPEFFALFDGAYVAHDVDETGKIIAKPRVEYFKKLREYLDSSPENNEKVAIFIDDKQHNIDGAHKEKELKFHGIKYENPEQLRNALIGLGILQEIIIDQQIPI